MPNSFFRFKQFTVSQEKSSMKVCTDSCLFGAWVADKIETKIIQPEKILDIGSGTGLLSLMLAQKSPAQIDAVEIDAASHAQTNDNFNESMWSKRLRAYHADIKTWLSPVKYDLIVTNPPFFENDLKSGNKNKNLAKHQDGLTLAELLSSISEHLAEGGNFAVLLPFHRVQFFKQIAAEKSYYLSDGLLVKQSPSHSFFRGMLLFAKEKATSSLKELTIKNKEGGYSEDFNYFLKDYYL